MHIQRTLLVLITTATTAHAAFTSMALHSGTPIHLRPLAARAGAIWVGGPTETYCPGSVVDDCGAFKNETVIGISSSTAYMSTSVPGGQQLFVAPDGALGYTQPHSASVPMGSYRTGFRRYPGAGELKYWTFDGAGGASGLLACPVGGEYKVFADVVGFERGDCEGIAVTRAYFGGVGAWEYT